MSVPLPAYLRARVPRATIAPLALLLGLSAGIDHAAAQPKLVASDEQTAAPALRGFDQVGLASWYGGRHDGRRTASGARFNLRVATAAHRSLALGTLVRVENLANGRRIELRITDRGPYLGGRIIDLSQAAADRLGLVRQGIGLVGLTVLAPASAHPTRLHP